MSSRQGWLLNNIAPSLVESNQFDVRAGVVRLFCANLGGNVPLLQWVGSTDNGVWVPVFRCGSEIQLSDTNNSYVEFIPGKYSIDATNADSNAMIWFEEGFATSGDDRTKWVYVISNCSCTPAPAPPPPSCTWYDVTNSNLFLSHGNYTWDGSALVNTAQDCCSISDPTIITNNGFHNVNSSFPAINQIRITVSNTFSPSFEMTPTAAVYTTETVGGNTIYTFDNTNTQILLAGAWVPDYINQFFDVAFADVVKIEICTLIAPPPPPG